MNRSISRFTTAALDAVGLNALLRWVRRRQPIILSYHGVCDGDSQLPDDCVPVHIPRFHFRRHIELLRQWGYEFVTMDGMLDLLRGVGDATRRASLTFDDGFANVITQAYPIMRDLGARGCVYVCPGLLGTNRLLWTDRVGAVLRSYSGPTFHFRFRRACITYPLGSAAMRRSARADITRHMKTLTYPEFLEHMTQFEDIPIPDELHEYRLADVPQLQSLDPDTLSVGSHTRTHAFCGSLTTPEALFEEITGATGDIERMLRHPVRHFSYPFGAFTDTVVQYLKEAGYHSAVTVQPGANRLGADPYRLKRIDAGGTGDHWDMYKAMISGTGRHLHDAASLLNRLLSPDTT